MSRFEWLEVPGKKKDSIEDETVRKEFDVEYYLKLADENYHEGQYEKSLRYYSKALNHDHKLEKPWIGQLFCLIDLGEYNESITWADKALEVFPGSHAILASKALAWGRLGYLEKAKAFSDVSLKAGGESSFVWWVRGDILMAENERNAEFCFNKAMELETNNWELLIRIGKTFLSVDKPLRAREYFLHARTIRNDIPLIWYWLGISYRQAKIYKEAEECFKRAVELNPHHPEFKKILSDIKRVNPFLKLIFRLKNFLK
ncbi:MAG: hypothetical protein A2161_02960 [Candidatus Schekmanbacteria bacterium RBG_13_48_7]|uniref:Uncharacterized protein n=1 Tax=Candidatus Schekmanbacteria bacterium RBG_13_48_7 TaxID=1817878 RepID=A0A1F7S258_9BACT|nr:MAG: hypothetical protein A2161_02960 [Candidatus Schekmanbacteria bacterium RBG_13_48_7]